MVDSLLRRAIKKTFDFRDVLAGYTPGVSNINAFACI